VLALGVLEGALFSLVRPNLFALIAESAPEGMAARAQAATGVMGVVGDLGAPALAALLWTRDYHLAFYSGAMFVLIMGMVGTLLIYRAGSRLGGLRGTTTAMPGVPGEPRAPAIDERT
jgi:MFS family permease